jgi:hypothetical protein
MLAQDESERQVLQRLERSVQRLSRLQICHRDIGALQRQIASQSHATTERA